LPPALGYLPLQNVLIPWIRSLSLAKADLTADMKTRNPTPPLRTTLPLPKRCQPLLRPGINRRTIALLARGWLLNPPITPRTPTACVSIGLTNPRWLATLRSPGA